jgi:hypothetical protein
MYYFVILLLIIISSKSCTKVFHGYFILDVFAVQMNSWVEKALKTVNCFAFLKSKLTVVIIAC